VGTAYVALVNYCFAKQHGGEFLLRIEDTDQARSTRESEQVILDALHWLGLTWDEGPDVGGARGPYRQSERSDIYKKYAQQLLDAGQAFKCFCSPQRLEEVRVAQRAAKKPPRYDGLCTTLNPDEVAAKERAGETFVVRMKIPESGSCVVHDMLRDPIDIPWSDVDMQVLMKSDGLPTYHLANVVDDHLMEITHVIRGEEWISSAPKHLLLYQYFGWEAPKLLHVPLLRNPDRSKLSKRKNPTSIWFFRQMGYLPQALVNFLGTLANSVGEGEEELMTLQQLVDRFKLEHIALGGPVFDIPKLDWMNGRYIRERLDAGAFTKAVADWGFEPARLQRIAELTHPRIERLSDLGTLCAFFFAGRLSITAEMLRGGKLDDLELRRAFQFALWGFDELRTWDLAGIEWVLKGVAESLERKFRDVARPFYVAVTGSPTSVPLYDAMEILGRDIVRERLRCALEALGKPSNAELDEWKRMHSTEKKETVIAKGQA